MSKRRPDTASSRKLERKIRTRIKAEKANFLSVFVKDLNRLADWLNALGTVQAAIVEHLGIKDQVDALIKSHLEAQNAVQIAAAAVVAPVSYTPADTAADTSTEASHEANPSTD